MKDSAMPTAAFVAFGTAKFQFDDVHTSAVRTLLLAFAQPPRIDRTYRAIHSHDSPGKFYVGQLDVDECASLHDASNAAGIDACRRQTPTLESSDTQTARCAGQRGAAVDAHAAFDKRRL